MKMKRIELNEDEIFLICSLLFKHANEIVEEKKQLEREGLMANIVKDRAIEFACNLTKKIIFSEEREQWAIRTDLRLGDLLKMVSTGQMIRVVFLTPDGGDETGNILEFENDPKDSNYTTTLLYEWVEWISSTPDDYLRVEIIPGKGRS